VTATEVGDDAAAQMASQRLAPLLPGIHDPFLHAVSRLAMAWTSPIAGDFDGALRGACDPGPRGELVAFVPERTVVGRSGHRLADHGGLRRTVGSQSRTRGTRRRSTSLPPSRFRCS
jgi:hypothetical protein